MAVVAADVKALATELASVSDGTVNTWIAIAERRVNRTAFGEKADDAVIFLSAHLVTVSQQANAGASGFVAGMQSRRVGDVSVTFGSMSGTMAMGDEHLRATLWGQLYLDLRDSIFADRRV